MADGTEQEDEHEGGDEVKDAYQRLADAIFAPTAQRPFAGLKPRPRGNDR